MFKHILIATDGSALSNHAIKKALQLAQSLSARVTGLTVSTPFHIFALDLLMMTNMEDAYALACEKRAARYLGIIKKAAAAAKVEFTGLHLFSGQPYEAIIQAAAANGCDLICMASHGRRGATALVLGSETMKVLTHSEIPVMVWRYKERREIA